MSSVDQAGADKGENFVASQPGYWLLICASVLVLVLLPQLGCNTSTQNPGGGATVATAHRGQAARGLRNSKQQPLLSPTSGHILRERRRARRVHSPELCIPGYTAATHKISVEAAGNAQRALHAQLTRASRAQPWSLALRPRRQGG